MKQERILLDHGSGGQMTNRLVSGLMVPLFDNPFLASMDDGACLDMAGGRMAFSTDSFVVDPLFFPGGNIGDLAVNGTVNDIAMCGGVPQYLSAALIVEEGFLTADLERILQSMAKSAAKAGVLIVTGDTKVVPKGAADKLFINTSGIGRIPEGIHISGANARPGDRVIVSGTIGDHGIAVLNQREGLSFEAEVKSDSQPLNHLVARMLAVSKDVRVLRDPTRGGVATALNEIARQSNTGIRIREKTIPVSKAVAGLCGILGLDPLYVANEGKLIAVVGRDHADAVLDAARNDPGGRDACVIGEVVSSHPGRVVMETVIGGERILGMLTGEQLPRIC